MNEYVTLTCPNCNAKGRISVTDKRLYKVRCPKCKEYFRYDFDNAAGPLSPPSLPSVPSASDDKEAVTKYPLHIPRKALIGTFLAIVSLFIIAVSGWNFHNTTTSPEPKSEEATSLQATEKAQPPNLKAAESAEPDETLQATENASQAPNQLADSRTAPPLVNQQPPDSGGLAHAENTLSPSAETPENLGWKRYQPSGAGYSIAMPGSPDEGRKGDSVGLLGSEGVRTYIVGQSNVRAGRLRHDG